jgi:hypothetical protein
MQINDLFLMDCDNYTNDDVLIAKKLYRLQSLSSGDFSFRQQYQTTIALNKEFAYRRITSLKKFSSIMKVRLSPLGQIIRLGE